MPLMVTHIPRYSLVLLSAIIIVAVASFWWANQRFEGRHYITTDLKELSPELVSDPALIEVVNRLSKGVEQRFLLAIEGDQEEQLEEALANLKQSLLAPVLSSASSGSSSPLLSIVDSDTVLTTLLPLLKKYRFNLLTPLQQKQLQFSTDVDIINMAQQQLYGFSTHGRVIPLLEDPLNFFSAYLTQLVQTNGLRKLM